ncbi:MAG: glycosyltransferase family 4 protein [Bacteroidia bacterium]|jgi:glycosyltransferase involved in cell wall biosynthesis|nr:glycosyltransferase family 4 protein [Bacteroidia bacterium]
MNILLIAFQKNKQMSKSILFFFSVTRIGGAETNMLKVAVELMSKGYKVHFAAAENNGTLFEQAAKQGISCTLVGKTSITPFHTISVYKKLLQNEKFDVVMNFGLRVEFFSRILTPIFLPKARIISNIRSTDSFRNHWHVFIDRISQGSVSCWVANSQAGKEAFVHREKINPNRIQVIYNYIDSIQVQANNIATSILQNPNIGLLANIRESKGHYDLIGICVLLLQKGISPTFLCAGEDLTNGDFSLKVKQAQLDKHFKLIGHINDKASFFGSIDLFVLPTYREGMPTVLLEAMQYGIPIVSTAIDGIPEQVTHNENGLLYSPGDLQNIANGINLLCTQPEMRKRFIDNGYAVLAKKFDKKRSILQWIDVINNGCQK